MTSGWSTKPLGEVASLIAGAGFPLSQQGNTDHELPFFKVGNLGEVAPGEFLTDSAHTVSATQAKLLGAKIIPAGSTVFAKIGMAIRLNRRRQVAQSSCIDNNMMAAVPDAGVIDSRYLLRFMETVDLMELAHATTVPSVRKADLVRIPVPVPPLAAQLVIVRAIDDLLAKRDGAANHLVAAKSKANRLRQAIRAAACSGRLTADWRDQHTAYESAEALIERSKAEISDSSAQRRSPQPWVRPDGPEIPESWRWAPMRDLAQIRGGIQKQPKRAPKDNPYPFLRVANVMRGKLDLSEMHDVELFDGEIDSYRLQPGDLLVVEGNGSASEIGRAAIWKDEVANCVHQNHIIRVRPLHILPEFADLFWNSPFGSREIASLAVTSAGLYSLSTKKIGIVSVPVPPLLEQQEIVIRASRLMAAANGLLRHLTVASDHVQSTSRAVLDKQFGKRRDLEEDASQLTRDSI